MFSFKPHVTASNKIRLAFDEHVTSSALDAGAYVIASLAPMGTAVVPSILSVEFYDSSERSILLTLERSLTFSKDYEIQVVGVKSIGGEDVISSTKSFTANVPDPPRVLGRFFQSSDAWTSCSTGRSGPHLRPPPGPSRTLTPPESPRP